MAETVDLVRVLARQMPDKAIAAVLNRAGKTTGRGNGWTQVAGVQPTKSQGDSRLIGKARAPGARRGHA